MPKPNPNSPSAVIDFEALPNPSAQDYYPKPKYLRIRSFGPFYPLSQPLKEPWCLPLRALIATHLLSSPTHSDPPCSQDPNKPAEEEEEAKDIFDLGFTGAGHSNTYRFKFLIKV